MWIPRRRSGLDDGAVGHLEVQLASRVRMAQRHFLVQLHAEPRFGRRQHKAFAPANGVLQYLRMESIPALDALEDQEVWAAGVTYLRSKVGRQEESKSSGGADFYAKVYEAERPEVFFKSTPHRIVGHRAKVAIRKDSTWDVPEPELTLVVTSSGKIVGYTIGNDMSSRSIEGENPLYLPQAKMYERSAALGPCLYVPEHEISLDTTISINIKRNGLDAFTGSIQLNRMKRKFIELAEYLFREFVFEHGCFLMTGTGIVPPNDFTLNAGDEIEIGIENIGILSNIVAYSK